MRPQLDTHSPTAKGWKMQDKLTALAMLAAGFPGGTLLLMASTKAYG